LANGQRETTRVFRARLKSDRFAGKSFRIFRLGTIVAGKLRAVTRAIHHSSEQLLSSSMKTTREISHFVKLAYLYAHVGKKRHVGLILWSVVVIKLID